MTVICGEIMEHSFFVCLFVFLLYTLVGGQRTYSTVYISGFPHSLVMADVILCMLCQNSIFWGKFNIVCIMSMMK